MYIVVFNTGTEDLLYNLDSPFHGKAWVEKEAAEKAITAYVDSLDRNFIDENDFIVVGLSVITSAKIEFSVLGDK